MTLIVSECSPAARDLWRVLSTQGIPTQVRTPHSVMADWWPLDSTPDVLLIDAAIDVDIIRGLVDRVVAGAERPPVVVSFADTDCASLASHVQDGHDYLIGPFRPHLVSSRLASGRRHRDVGAALGAARTAVDQSHFERELQIGREIQRGFLPAALPVVEGWDIAAWFQPAREVSGDFYDAYDIINGTYVAFAIADVCDKGIGAALFMALIRSLLRHAAVGVQPTDDAASASATLALRAVRATNDYLTANHLHQAYFATLFFGVVNPGTGDLVYINCGHNPPILRRADGRQTTLPPTGPALGLLDNARFDLGRQTMDPGDFLFLYTDGVPEAKSVEGTFLGDDRMRAMLAEPGTAAAVVDRFVRAVSAHAGAAEQFDDVTMLGLRRQAFPASGEEER